MNKILTILTILVISIGFLFIPDQKTSGKEFKKTITINKIIYNDKGFSPAVIKIRKGTMITFINQSSNILWVGSNPHPQHTDYPEFDSLKGIRKGDKYQFTFKKNGDWGYHNHLKPLHKGKIIAY